MSFVFAGEVLVPPLRFWDKNVVITYIELVCEVLGVLICALITPLWVCQGH